MKRAVFLIILLLVVALSVPAFEFSTFTIRDSFLDIESFDFGAAHVPSIWTNSLGVSFDFEISPLLFFCPSLDIYSATYQWNTDYLRAVPVDEASREAQVIGLLIDVPIIFRYSFTPAFAVEGGGGLCFVIPISFLARNAATGTSGDATPENVALIGNWFYGALRFIRPSLSIGVRYELNYQFVASLWTRLIIPLYNLWDGSGVPFYDNLDWNIGFAISVRIGAQPPPDDTATGSSAATTEPAATPSPTPAP